MALADFIIIGAMKCGTSTLQTQLAAQPGIFMTTPKEPNFFSDDPVFARGQDWYSALFATAAAGDIKGEASTHYTKLPTYPETVTRMAQMLDAPRFVYMIRNPLDRAVSHFIHEWTERRMSNDMIQAFDAHPELVSYGCYGDQLAPYVAQFGRERIMLTSLEQLKADPQGELDQICAFLGLAQAPVWHQEQARQNVSSARIRRLPLHGLLIEHPLAQYLRRALVPKSIRQRIRSARSFGDRPQMPAELRSKLEQSFLKDRATLAAVFPAHPALCLCYPFAAL